MQFRTPAPVVFLLGAAWLASGCQPTANVATPAAAPGIVRDDWDALYLDGKKLGHGHTVERLETVDGQPRVVIEATLTLSVLRSGQAHQSLIRLKSVETPGREVLQCESTNESGGAAQRSLGKVAGQRLQIQSIVDGRAASGELPWPAGTRGYFAVEQELADKPLSPGERRQLAMLLPLVDQVVRTELAAEAREPVQLADGTRSLLRVSVVHHVPEVGPQRAVYWVDQRGRVLKQREEGTGLETRRVDRATAEASDGAKVDVLESALVPLDRPLAAGHAARKAVYLVELKDGDPAATFAQSVGQRVESLGNHRARVTVRSVAPDRLPAGAAAEPPPTDDERQPSGLIQSDDELVVRLAREAAGDEQNPWLAALRLRRAVRQHVQNVSFSQAIASAAEVARSRQGDCTEHAVLLAALARAQGIPSRVAVGLVYVQARRALGYHMWTEVYVDGHWLPLDATLDGDSMGPGHLKLGHSSLRDSGAMLSFVRVMQVVGRLSVALESQE